MLSYIHSPKSYSVNLSYIHPRLFSTLVLLDPVIHEYSASPVEPPQRGPAYLSTFRRDLWPSREAAIESFHASKFYQKWDPRVLDRWIKHGIRDLPTVIYPEDNKANNRPQVTLATTKHQEVFTFLRPNFDAKHEQTGAASRETHPDLNQNVKDLYPFYRAEPVNTFLRLSELRPSALYIFGELSDMSASHFRQKKMEVTGVGVGGSGGAKEGRVKEVVLKGVGHLVAMEAVAECAEAIGPWISTECQRIARQDVRLRAGWAAKSQAQKTMIDEKWLEMMGPPPKPSRSRGKM